MSGQAAASGPPSASLPFFGLCFRSHSFPRRPPLVHLFPMAAGLFLQKQTPRAPVPSFSHIFPPLLSRFSASSTAWFTLTIRLWSCPRVCLPCAPSEGGALGSCSGRARVCFAVSPECCYDSSRKPPPRSSPHSHQRCASQRLWPARLHTPWSRSSSSPPGERQLACDDSSSSSSLPSLLGSSLKYSAQRKTPKPT